MTKTEQCRARAEDCRTLATVVDNPDVRGAYEEMAKQWEHLAARFEQHEAGNWKQNPPVDR